MERDDVHVLHLFAKTRRTSHVGSLAAFPFSILPQHLCFHVLQHISCHQRGDTKLGSRWPGRLAAAKRKAEIRSGIFGLEKIPIPMLCGCYCNEKY